jgi:plasmid segregation protein ParM
MKVCTSLYSGANNLFNQINEVSRSKGKQNIPDAIIEGILLREPTTLHDASSERIELVQTQADRFARELLLEISNDRLDLTEYRTVFVGGGSILLKEHIEKTGLVSKPIFVDNVRANVEGYHLLYENLNPTHTQKEA